MYISVYIIGVAPARPFNASTGLDPFGSQAYKVPMMYGFAIIIRITCPALWPKRAAGTNGVWPAAPPWPP